MEFETRRFRFGIQAILPALGKEFLPKLGGSDTQQRQMLAELGLKIATGSGAATGAAATGSIFGAVPVAGLIGANAAAQKFINQNPKVVRKILDNAKKPKWKPTAKEAEILDYLATIGASVTAGAAVQTGSRGASTGDYQQQ